MLDDNLVFEIEKDAEEKYITIIDNKNNGSLRRKLEKESVPYETIGYDDLLAGKYCPDPSKFNMMVLMLDLGLHSRPEELKSAVEKSIRVGLHFPGGELHQGNAALRGCFRLLSGHLRQL